MRSLKLGAILLKKTLQFYITIGPPLTATFWPGCFNFFHVSNLMYIREKKSRRRQKKEEMIPKVVLLSIKSHKKSKKGFALKETCKMQLVTYMYISRLHISQCYSNEGYSPRMEDLDSKRRNGRSFSLECCQTSYNSLNCSESRPAW